MKEEAKLLLRLRSEIFDLKAEIDLLRRIKEGNCTLIEDLDDFMLKEKMMLDKDEATGGCPLPNDYVYAKNLNLVNPNTVKAALEREHVGFEGFKAPDSVVEIEQNARKSVEAEEYCNTCHNRLKSTEGGQKGKHCIIGGCNGRYK